MELATINDPMTTMGGMALGRICVKMISALPWPESCAAATNSRSRNDRNSPRTSRATGGQETIAIAQAMDCTEGWKIATRTIAKAKPGMAWKISVKRISIVSTQPPW
ncbi:hypothetical protein D9M68_916300 [compost metagenome]